MPFQLLLVEPSEAVAQRILLALREAGLDPRERRVETLTDLRAALGEAPWDALLCAQDLPGLPCGRVLAELHALGLALPCIVLAPSADEESITRALHLGARDFVSLERLARLPQVLRRALAHPGDQTPPPGEPVDALLNLMDEAYGLHEVIYDASGRAVDFRFLQVNAAYERLTHFRAQDVVGRRALELAPELDPSWIERFGQIARSGEPTPVDDYRSLHGRTFSGLVFSPQPGQFGVLFNDVTDSKAMKASRERLLAAMDQAGEGIFTADLAGLLTYANPALERALGLPAHSTRGLPLGELLPGLPEGGPWQGRLTVTGEDGRARILACTLASVLDERGRPTSKVGVARDITGEAETERNLRQMEKMKSLGEVAGGVSRDFNNLLTAILSASELIEWQLAADSPIRLKLQVIYMAVMRARELNRQILAFSRNSEDAFVPFDLSAVVKEAVHLVRTTFPATVEVRASMASGLWATGDGAQIHQVVMNLALNALQAMLPGGGSLEITLRDEGASARLQVKDSGCGMEPALLDRIFEPFFTTKGPDAGKGLGLSVVHGIVTSHSGTVSVASEPGKGSTFTVTLPCTLHVEAELQDPDREEVTGSERILFVDDEEVLSALGKQGLQMLGYRVTSRSDSQEALEEIRHRPQDFDILVTDLSMPGLSGLELLQQARKIRPDMPGILITGVFQEPSALEGQATPFEEVLLKPVSILAMAKAIRKTMDGRPARPAERAAEAPSLPLGPVSILLAEDSNTTRSLLRSWLVKAGYQVQEARDGQEAWEAMEAAPGRFALLITDIIMPRMDGLQLSGKVRSLDASIPILMLSSSEDTESVKEALHLHVNEFLTKPFESRLLVSTVTRLCADQASRVKALRSQETARAVRMAQRAMEAVPEKDLPMCSVSEPLTDAGGDVFRAYRREDGSILFAIADVAGHSVISSYAVAAFLGMLTNFIATDLDLRSLALRLSKAIQAGPFSEVPICALLGHWDPSAGRLHLLNAGIPHAQWHQAARGRTLPVEINGTPLGILDDPLVEDKVLLLAPGDRLLLGSDGFFDAASAEGAAFQDLVGAIWQELGATPILEAINLVSEAARTHAGGTFGDDLLVVALEQPELPQDPDSLRLSLPSEPRAIDGACRDLSAFLDERDGPGAEGRYDMLLAVREALSNAMIHGNGAEGATIALWARRLPGGGYRITVVDEGQGFDLEGHQAPDTTSSVRGRGIPLIRHFARNVTMVGGELAMVFN